jgi:hypothetical protein
LIIQGFLFLLIIIQGLLFSLHSIQGFLFILIVIQGFLFLLIIIQGFLFSFHSIQGSLFLLNIIKASSSAFTASWAPSFFLALSRHPLLQSQHPGLPLSSQHRQCILFCIHRIQGFLFLLSIIKASSIQGFLFSSASLGHPLMFSSLPLPLRQNPGHPFLSSHHQHFQ